MRNAFSRAFAMPASKPTSSSCINTITSTTSHFGTILQEELPERLVPPDLDQEMDARRSRCRRGYRGDAWRASRARCGDLSRPAYLLRSGELHLSICRPRTTGLDEPIIWESVVASVEFQGKNLRSITFRPIALNKIGQGQPDTHDEHTE